jgi:hypothetical protein
VKIIRRLNLRRLAQIGELNKLRTRNACSGGLFQNRIIAKRRADVGGPRFLPIAVVSLSPIISSTGTEIFSNS